MKFNKTTGGFFWFESLVLPALYIVLIFYIDRLFSEARVIGLMCLVGLFMMAFRLKPAVMLAWGCVYALVMFQSLGLFKPLPSTGLEHWAPVARSSSFSVAVAITFLLCLHRSRLQKTADEMLAILSTLPVPVVLSDGEGIIRFVNDTAVGFFERPRENLTGESFFSVLTNPKEQGRTIARYFEIFDRAGSGQTAELELQIRGKSGMILHGHMAVAASIRPRLLITVLKPAGQSPARAPSV